jgi:hypothetical protein
MVGNSAELTARGMNETVGGAGVLFIALPSSSSLSHLLRSNFLFVVAHNALPGPWGNGPAVGDLVQRPLSKLINDQDAQDRHYCTQRHKSHHDLCVTLNVACQPKQVEPGRGWPRHTSQGAELGLGAQ